MKVTSFMVLVILWATLPVKAQQLNGFDLRNALIPAKDILPGGPPRDGIPSIDKPVFVQAKEYHEYPDHSQVLGVYFNGIAKAYPIKIMDWHEIVNDKFGGKPVAVTYCPLCGSGIAFKANAANGKPTEFGVSGLLYNSDVLLYDRNTNSLWSQILGKAVTGPLKSHLLEPINTQRLTLGAWKKMHPGTLVLTTQTGFTRNYQITPYSNYDSSDKTYFPVANSDETFHKKEWVIGVENNGVFKAYSVRKLAKLPQQQLKDQVGGETIYLAWDKDAQHVTIKKVNGQEIVGLQMFWFAWVAFHPETKVMK